MKGKLIRRPDLVYPDLSYEIVGILFDVYNELGYGQEERAYQKAVSVGLRKSGFAFKEQVYFPLEYRGEKVGKSYLDFIVDGKMVLEIKKGDKFSKTHIDQVYRYLVTSGLKLGVLAYFSPRSVHFKRIVNLG